MTRGVDGTLAYAWTLQPYEAAVLWLPPCREHKQWQCGWPAYLTGTGANFVMHALCGVPDFVVICVGDGTVKLGVGGMGLKVYAGSDSAPMETHLCHSVWLLSAA